MPANRTLIGPGGRLFAEPQPGRDEAAFRVDNTSQAYFNSPYFKLHQKQVQPIPAPRKNAPPSVDLAGFVGPDVMKAIAGAGKITFHAVGDTGAAKVNQQQAAVTAIAHEAAVADAMAQEVAANRPDAPVFLFHLGDVIYYFGEGQYYYDQFYEPFRGYDRPIFPIPGNHDGMVFGQGSSAQVPTLAAFLRNFCAAAPGPSPDAGGLVRSAMTLPGVYFTLDAPFVSIIGLYSNVLEGPGVISSQGGHYPIGDDQLTFLNSELGRLRPDREAGKRAVVLALHHPPVSADTRHAGSTGVQSDIDAACRKAGLWPDLVVSGHAHLYQRFTRSAGGKDTPYIVAGSGGFAVTPPQQTLGAAPVRVDAATTLVVDPILKFGYLAITTDAKTLSVSFRSPTGTGVAELDFVTIDLQAGKLVGGRGTGGAAVTAGAGAGGPGKRRGGGAAARRASHGRTPHGRTSKGRAPKAPRPRGKRRRK